jgi:hypothetical protein
MAAGWASALDLVRDDLVGREGTDFRFTMLIAPLTLDAVEGRHLIVGAPAHAVTSVRERYAPLLLRAVRAAIDDRCTLEVRPATEAAGATATPEPSARAAA